MITHLPILNRVRVANSEKLYPKGVDWNIDAGVNAIIGGTGLGKTTLIYAIQFAIFGKLIVEGLKGVERIEKEFFRGRMSKRKGSQLESHPPTVEVWFTVESKTWRVKRSLLTGTLLEVDIDGESLKRTSDYPVLLARAVGLEKDFSALSSVQAHLLFFGEGRYLVAWENLLQNELLNLIFADNERYKKLNSLWEVAKSADSSARNLSAQAVRLERDLKEAGIQSDAEEELNVDSVGEIEILRTNIRAVEQALESIREQLTAERELQAQQTQLLTTAQSTFNESVAHFELAASDDFDRALLADVTVSPTSLSVRSALEQFYDHPNDRSCPSCGRPGLEQRLVSLTRIARQQAKAGHCIVCSKALQQRVETSSSLRESVSNARASKAATELQRILFLQIQTRNRVDHLSIEESTLLDKLAAFTADEVRLLQSGTYDSTENSLKITIRQLRASQRDSVKERDKALRTLRRQLSSADQLFTKRQKTIAKAFKKYATLYLDEPCDIKFLREKELPARRGSQVKPPHSAFYPVISNEIRPSSQDLSDAQRSFVDLAFRMAVLDVWHQQTGATATLVVETPEGAVDLAYMGRVARMLRVFAKQGHTLLVTTNLNNDVFLPELMSSKPASERKNHILNLLKLGRPRPVQKESGNKERFENILKEVARHPMAQ